MHEFFLKISLMSAPTAVRIREETLKKILTDHIRKRDECSKEFRERWGLVLDSESVAQIHNRDEAKLTADEEMSLITTLKRELTDAAALPRMIVYVDNESGKRNLRLLLSDRCLIAVVKVLVSGQKADLLTAFVPSELGHFSETDTPNNPDKLAFRRVRKQFVMKYCPLEEFPLRLPDEPWSRVVYKPWGQRVDRDIQGFIDPMHWGFSSNSPGAAFTGSANLSPRSNSERPSR